MLVHVGQRTSNCLHQVCPFQVLFNNWFGSTAWKGEYNGKRKFQKKRGQREKGEGKHTDSYTCDYLGREIFNGHRLCPQNG